VSETPTKAPSKNKVVKGEFLEGKALLDKSKSMTGSPIDEVAKACGYYKEVTNTETGEVKVSPLTTDFMAAMLKAQSGVEFAPPARVYSRRTSRPPTVTVGGNGNIVVGNRYSSVAGFAPSSKVQVEATEGKIVITYFADAAEEGAEPVEEDLDL
jgi:hypothetical protein